MNIETELIKIVEKYNLRKQDRKDGVVALRRAFSFYAHTMGVHTKTIAEWLDLDRTAVIHQLKQMDGPDVKYYLYTPEIRRELVELRKKYEYGGYTNIDVLTKSIQLITLTQDKAGILNKLQEVKRYINFAFDNSSVSDSVNNLISWIFNMDISMKRVDLIEEVERLQAYINENINPNKL